jgi:hypothetical protein
MGQERKLSHDRGEAFGGKITVKLDVDGKPKIVMPERAEPVETTEAPPVAPNETSLDPLKHATWLTGGGG